MRRIVEHNRLRRARGYVTVVGVRIDETLSYYFS